VRSRILRKLTTIAVAGLVFTSSATASLQLNIPRLHLVTPLNYVSQDIGPRVYFQDSNTLAVAGHRVTPSAYLNWPYGAFYYINNLRLGDRIYVRYNKWVNIYKVVKIYPQVLPGMVRSYTRLPGIILSACTPRHSAKYRYVVRGKLIKSIRSKT
jgi:hypothetical protein